MADDKNYPPSNPGIAKLLNIKPDPTPQALPTQDLEESTDSFGGINYAEKATDAPTNLPIGDTFTATEQPQASLKDTLPEPLSPQPESQTNVSALPDPIQETDQLKFEPVDLESLAMQNEPPKSHGVGYWLKAIAPFVAIFIIGIGLYFYYFSSFSFLELFNSNKLKIETVTEDQQTNKNLEQLKTDVASDYKKWINQFFADVNDESIIAMDADVSGNGLSNLEKYLLNLNPTVYSTRGSIGDGESVIEGTNPWTGKPFTDRQKKLLEKYINPELISNRITAAAITRGVTKYAQYVNPDSPYYIDPATLAQAGASNSPIIEPVQIGGAPAQPPSTPTSSPRPTSPQLQMPPVDNSGNLSLNSDQAIDLSKSAVLEIPSLKITVPLVWTKDVKDFDKDLKRGVVHYPGTALPGDVGTSYISGHSSGYAWDKSPYKVIFASLGGLNTGASFTITATQKNGKTVKFNYVVDRRGEYAANDQAQFISTSDSVVALSTCWPIGTVDRRLVIFGKLTQTER